MSGKEMVKIEDVVPVYISHQLKGEEEQERVKRGKEGFR